MHLHHEQVHSVAHIGHAILHAEIHPCHAAQPAEGVKSLKLGGNRHLHHEQAHALAYVCRAVLHEQAPLFAAAQPAVHAPRVDIQAACNACPVHMAHLDITKHSVLSTPHWMSWHALTLKIRALCVVRSAVSAQL